MKLSNAFRIVIFIISIFVIACSNKRDENYVQQSNQIDTLDKVKEIMIKDYTDATELLSIKHNISQVNSKVITSEYIKIFDPILQQIITGVNDERVGEKIFKPDESLDEFIKRMNRLTGESTEKISSYIFDLKIYIKVMEETE